MNDALIYDAVRTPIGRYAGALSAVRADDLAAVPLRELMRRNPAVDWAGLDEVILGCANQAGEDNRNVARMAALLAGLPAAVPGGTVNRLCGSGMDAVGTAARAVKCGEAQLIIAGGVECMSRAPFVMPKPERAFSRDARIYDTTLGWRFINPLMRRQYGVDSMPETAENVAEDFAVSRRDQDAFALRSQQRAARAQEKGWFAEEIAAVTTVDSKGQQTTVAQDQHPRPATTAEALARLPAPFREGGTVTAGNASGVNDGACALLVGDRRAGAKYDLTAGARIVAMATAGVEPRIMGFGPAPAAEKLLARTGLKLRDMDVIEINEAFAAQVLAVTRHLGLADDAAQVNPNGGAIALGHPLGMSGARLVATAMRQLHRSHGRYALCAMCIGVGQGIAVIIENMRAG
ncbi:MAG: 3-oxoadipyl-CoA thiolase [Gammaproteobacteria bacterium]|nr:3-oxoadipyl-CoA thiolase [Gammaproteobacteria bacterium]MDD9873940.1 3-oxoadipyl-CoA thiolase [Gammaproteobacteria bacterium]